jgi:hypothetical protein
MPEWLIGLLQGLAKEGPAFAILLGAGWIMFRHLALNEYLKQLTEQHKEHVASLNVKQEAELGRLEAVYDKAMAAKDGEIARLLSEKEAIQKDRDSLYKQIKAEQKKP